MSNDCYALSPPPDSRGSRHKIQDRDHGKRQELRQADALHALSIESTCDVRHAIFQCLNGKRQLPADCRILVLNNSTVKVYCYGHCMSIYNYMLTEFFPL